MSHDCHNDVTICTHFSHISVEGVTEFVFSKPVLFKSSVPNADFFGGSLQRPLYLFHPMTFINENMIVTDSAGNIVQYIMQQYNRYR